MPAGELRLGLTGRALAFPDGRPFCLVCGRKPFACRTLPFRDAEYAIRKSQNLNSLLEWFHPVLAFLNFRRKLGFSIEAPLCFRHYWRGLIGEFLVIGIFLAAMATVLILYWKGAISSGPSETGAMLKGGLIGILILGGWVLARLGKGKPVLNCDVKRESDTRVLLVYPDGVPAPR